MLSYPGFQKDMNLGKNAALCFTALTGESSTDRFSLRYQSVVSNNVT